MTATRIADGAAIAVIDDVPEDAEGTEAVLDEAGLDPHVVQLNKDPDRMVETLREFRGVVCDHRLQRQVGYFGAELVEKCMRVGLPAVLLTTYARVDDDPEVQRRRRYIPHLLIRGAGASGDSMRAALDEAARETAGEYAWTRKPFRTPVRLVAIRDGLTPMAELLAPAWSSESRIAVPLDALTQPPSPRIGDRFLADVNINCELEQDIYAANFESLPPASLEDLAPSP